MNSHTMNNDSVLFDTIDCQSINKLNKRFQEDFILGCHIPSRDLIEQQTDVSSLQNLDDFASEILYTKKNYQICNLPDYPDRYLETISWEGYIESISKSDETITGRMHEIGTIGTDESIVFDFNDITPDDFSLVQVGAIFYYSIGYALTKGQKKKEALLRFKRSVNFTEDDVDEISNDVKQLVDEINWE